MFGYSMCDHITATSLEPQGLDIQQDACFIMNQGMHIECYPLGSKTSRDGQRALFNLIGPVDGVCLLHTDAAQELIQAMDELQIRH